MKKNSHKDPVGITSSAVPDQTASTEAVKSQVLSCLLKPICQKSWEQLGNSTFLLSGIKFDMKVFKTEVESIYEIMFYRYLFH